MESTRTHEPVPLLWKIAIMAPPLVALALTFISSRGMDPNAIRMRIIGNMFTPLSLIAVGTYWVHSRRQVGWGMFIIGLGSAALGFGAAVLLRAI